MEIDEAVAKLKQIGLAVRVNQNNGIVTFSGAEKATEIRNFMGSGKTIIGLNGDCFKVISTDLGWTASFRTRYIPGHGICENEFPTLNKAVDYLSHFFVLKRTFSDGSVNAKAALVKLRSCGISAKYSPRAQGRIVGGVGELSIYGDFIYPFTIYRKGKYYIALAPQGVYDDPLLTFTKSLMAAVEAVCTFYESKQLVKKLS